ncbi:MAG TPA: hypothetical protein PLI86_03965 [bacterium]|nr:hypothetical protein [bacterium]
MPRRARAAGKAGDAHHAVVRERAQLLSIFDGIDEVVYISDPRTHEILYLNGAARAVFGDAVGKKCYRAFQRRRTPCQRSSGGGVAPPSQNTVTSCP